MRRAALVGVAAVSPIIEISECTRALERPGNALYQWNFVPRPEAADAAQGRSCARARSTCRRLNAIKTVRAVRRDLHRAVFRLPQRRGLLPPRQRDARRSTASACRRSSSPPRTIRSCRRSRSTIRKSPATRTSTCGSARTAATAASSARVGDRRWLLGGEADRGVSRASHVRCVARRTARPA